MSEKTVDLVKAKARMEQDNVSGVLARVNHRIHEGDLKGALAVLVIVQNEFGDYVYETGDTLEDAEAGWMSFKIAQRIARKGEDDEDDDE